MTLTILSLFLLAVAATGTAWAGDLPESALSGAAPADSWTSDPRNELGLGPDEKRLPGLLVSPESLGELKAAPSEFDWRNNNGNYVSGVRDQNPCASCAQYGYTAMIESKVLIAMNWPNSDVDLSEMALKCNWADTRTYLQTQGIPPERFLHEDKQTCGTSPAVCNIGDPEWTRYAIRVENVIGLAQPSLDQIKTLLYNYGPLATSMIPFTDMGGWRPTPENRGVYVPDSDAQPRENHSVLLVGYSDAESCFILKNSWGSGWGDQGFFKILYSELSPDSLTQFARQGVLWVTDVFVPGHPAQAAAGDYDGDGLEDVLLLAGHGEGKLTGWLYTSDGSHFTVTNPIRANASIERLKSVAGDFNGDGKDELAFFSLATLDWSTIVIWEVRKDAIAGHGAGLGTSSEWRNSTLLAADIDGDGRDEIVALEGSNGQDNIDIGLHVWRFNSDFTLASDTTIWTQPLGWWSPERSKWGVTDVDGDGKDEIACLYDYSNMSLGFETGLWIFDIDAGSVSTKRVWTDEGDIIWLWDRSGPLVGGDLNGDGKGDVGLFYDYRDDAKGLIAVGLWVLDVGSGPGPAVPTLRWASDGFDARRMRTVGGDYDGDGTSEVASFYEYSGLGNRDQGLFTWHADRSPAVADYIWSKQLGPWTVPAVPLSSSSFDRISPTASSRRLGIGSNGGIVVWSPCSDDAHGSGLKSCSVAYRERGSASRTLVSLSPTARSVVLGPTVPGKNYLVSATATDKNENVVGWSRENAISVPRDQSSMSYRGTWLSRSNRKFYRGTTSVTNIRGSSAEASFSGASRLGLIITTGPAGGLCDVFLNGVLVRRNLSFFSETFTFQQRIWFKAPPGGRGTIKVVVKGLRPLRSKGAFVEIDGLHVVRVGDVE